MSLLTPDRQMTSAPRCDRPVQGDGIMSFHCTLPQGHDQVNPEDPEPCFAVESARSARRWDAWKRRQMQATTDENGSVYIVCPACDEKAMQVHDGKGVCGNCGNQAELQPDLPDEAPASIEEILEDQPEPARVLVSRQDDRPEVLVANDAAIKAGDIHNPFDAQCSTWAPLAPETIEGERCYICRPEDAEEPLPEPAAEETDEEIQQAARGFEVDLTPEQGDALMRGKIPEGLPPIPGVTAPLQGIVGTFPTKQREGDQVLPAGGDRVVQDWIIETMEESKRVGVERYGQPLMTFDGRSNIRDLADELRDAFVYISKMQMMAEADRETLVRMAVEALEGAKGEYPEEDDHQKMAEAVVDRILDWVLTQRLGPDTVLP